MAHCKLCGGTLSPEGRCLECGMDNSKNDSMYHLNEHNEKAEQMHPGSCEENLNRETVRQKVERSESARTVREQGEHSRETPPTPAPVHAHTREIRERRKAGTVQKKSGLPAMIFWVIFVLVILAMIRNALGY